MNLLVRFAPIPAALVILLAAGRAEATSCEPADDCLCDWPTPPATILDGVYHDVRGPRELEVTAVHGDPQDYEVGDIVELDQFGARSGFFARDGDRVLTFVYAEGPQPGSGPYMNYLLVQQDGAVVLCREDGTPVDPQQAIEYALSPTCYEDTLAAGFDYDCGGGIGGCTLGDAPSGGWSGLLVLFGLLGAGRLFAAARRR